MKTHVSVKGRFRNCPGFLILQQRISIRLYSKMNLCPSETHLMLNLHQLQGPRSLLFNLNHLGTKKLQKISEEKKKNTTRYVLNRKFWKKSSISFLRLTTHCWKYGVWFLLRSLGSMTRLQNMTGISFLSYEFFSCCCFCAALQRLIFGARPQGRQLVFVLLNW